MRIAPRNRKPNSASPLYFLNKALVALFMVGLIAFAPDAFAQTPTPFVKGAPKIDLNWSDAKKPRNMSLTRLRAKLRPADEYATLNALLIALNRVGDGQTYVWGRPKRQLRAFITPISSYRNPNGTICREIVVSLALGSYLKRIETAACRAKDRSWKLQS